MLKVVIASCVAVALGGVAACTDEAPKASAQQPEAVPDDTADRPVAVQGSPQGEPVRAVAVKYVVDPSGSAQIGVSSGVQAAPTTPTPVGAPRRRAH